MFVGETPTTPARGGALNHPAFTYPCPVILRPQPENLWPVAQARVQSGSGSEGGSRVINK